MSSSFITISPLPPYDQTIFSSTPPLPRPQAEQTVCLHLGLAVERGAGSGKEAYEVSLGHWDPAGLHHEPSVE